MRNGTNPSLREQQLEKWLAYGFNIGGKIMFSKITKRMLPMRFPRRVLFRCGFNPWFAVVAFPDFAFATTADAFVERETTLY